MQNYTFVQIMSWTTVVGIYFRLCRSLKCRVVTRTEFTLGAWVWYSLGTNVNTPFFQVPTLEFGHGAVAWAQGLTKVDTRLPCADNVCKLWAVHCFVLAVKLLFQIGFGQGKMQYLCIQSQIGYSKCEHNTILCQYPWFPSTKCGQPCKAGRLTIRHYSLAFNELFFS